MDTLLHAHAVNHDDEMNLVPWGGGSATNEDVNIAAAHVKKKYDIALSNVSGGAFMQVLVDSGVDRHIASIMHGSGVSPILLAWSVAAFLRIALGSATVAAITASGIVAPLIATTGTSPELMVLAVGSGSVIFSHVNDPGFWMFKEYFNLSIMETVKSWSALETIISVCGLVGCLLLNMAM